MSKFTYRDFVEKVNELGFITPYVDLNVPKEQAWCNDPDLDPWFWKDRAAQEKKLAYGSFFNGKKGYISPRYYSVFVDAFKPRKSVEERYEAGKLGKYEWAFWNLLNEQNRPLGTNEYRKLIGVTAKDGRSALDAAVVRMQMTFDIATVGNVAMLDKDGNPFNWAVGYDKIENWVPPEWMTLNPRMEHEEALEMLIHQAEIISNKADAGQAKKVFDQSLKLYKTLG